MVLGQAGSQIEKAVQKLSSPETQNFVSYTSPEAPNTVLILADSDLNCLGQTLPMDVILEARGSVTTGGKTGSSTEADGVRLGV